MADQYDEYLLEIYRHAGENARMYATSRFSNLTGFLTYVSVLTAALAFLYGGEERAVDLSFAVPLVAVLGCVLSVLFLALEVRHHYWWEYYELDVVAELERQMGRSQYPDDVRSGGSRSFVGKGRRSPLGLSATHATYGIYLTSLTFFLVVGVASALT